jgi:hypothetical protein
METEIINRVANSALVQIDLEDWYPVQSRKEFDLSSYLFQGLILKELDFRSALKQLDWTPYQNAIVAVHCSADAIVPTWAFMLIGQYLSAVTGEVYFCTPERLDDFVFQRIIDRLDVETYKDQKVIVKGCSKLPVPTSAFVAISVRLTPIVQSLMFGEPCSNVPLYKKKKSI